MYAAGLTSGTGLTFDTNRLRCRRGPDVDRARETGRRGSSQQPKATNGGQVGYHRDDGERPDRRNTSDPRGKGQPMRRPAERDSHRDPDT